MTKKAPDPKGGVEEVAKMLQHMEEPHRSRLLADVARQNPELAQKIQARMFTFEDLIRENPLRIQKCLRSVPPKKLALAMRGISEELKGFLFKQMSTAAAKVLVEEIDTTPPQKRSDVEAAQREILALFKKA